MLGIPLGLLYANGMEWVLHKHVLHKRGKRKKSMWSFHYHEHHKMCRRHDNADPNYLRSPLGWNAQGKEVFSLAAVTALHLPLAPVAPLFTATLLYSVVNYYRVHKRAHMDPEWGKQHLTWHWDHHMGPDQDANWCVTRPWFDHLMGTRKPFAFTEAEAERAQRRGKSTHRPGASERPTAGFRSDIRPARAV